MQAVGRFLNNDRLMSALPRADIIVASPFGHCRHWATKHPISRSNLSQSGVRSPLELHGASSSHSARCLPILLFSLEKMARPERFERPTLRFVV